MVVRKQKEKGRAKEGDESFWVTPPAPLFSQQPPPESVPSCKLGVLHFFIYLVVSELLWFIYKFGLKLLLRMLI